MASLGRQRDLILTFKKQICSNVGILSKIHPMSTELTRQIFKEDALEKPTQQVFIHLSYYLVCIIDPQKATTFTWPLYDAKSEKTYKDNFASFVLSYSKTGAVNPVMSSYFVNPGCFKVIKLIFQLSVLAIDRTLIPRLLKESQKVLYGEAKNKYTFGCSDFFEFTDKEAKIMNDKFLMHRQKMKVLKEASDQLRNKIRENEAKIADINQKHLLANVVDGFLAKHEIQNSELKEEFVKIKDVHSKTSIFDIWLEETDKHIDFLEMEHENKVLPTAELIKSCHSNTEALIARQNGQMDKKLYMIEYDHEKEPLCTKAIETEVNSEQKYILKNIVKEGTLNLPNLIRSLVIAVGIVMKNTEDGQDIQKVTEYLHSAKKNYSEMVTAMKILNERLMNADSQLPIFSCNLFETSMAVRELPQIPPLPDLSELRSARDICQPVFDSHFTPINLTKHQFNLRRKANLPMFAKPHPRPFIMPFHHRPREDILKALISTRKTCYEKPKLNMSHNISLISQQGNRVNETIAVCSSGFTKNQIQRLLATKKTSSSKKHKFSSQRPEINIKKGGLFNESVDSNNLDSTNLFRSNSSPNLFDNKEKRLYTNARGRKLSVMQESCKEIASLIDVSGISIIHSNSNSANGSPNMMNLEDSRKKVDTSNLPIITITPDETVLNKMQHVLKETELTSEIINITDNDSFKAEVRKSTENILKVETVVTPNISSIPAKKTSSLEKIIARYKKVRESSVGFEDRVGKKDFRTIVEERENNMNAVNVDTANRILLPDLLSPSSSTLSKKQANEYLDDSFEVEEK